MFFLPSLHHPFLGSDPTHTHTITFLLAGELCHASQILFITPCTFSRSMVSCHRLRWSKCSYHWLTASCYLHTGIWTRQTLKPTLSTHLKVLPVLTVLHTEAVHEGLAADSLATRGFGSFSHTLHRQIPAQPGSGASRSPPAHLSQANPCHPQPRLPRKSIRSVPLILWKQQAIEKGW